MKILNRIARPCGIVGSVWAVLLAIFYSLFFATHFVTATIGRQSWGFRTATTDTWATLAVIILMALMGLLGLLSTILSMRTNRLSRIFIWVSALATLVISLLSGLLLLPAAILLILAAIGIGKKKEAPPTGVGTGGIR